MLTTKTQLNQSPHSISHEFVEFIPESLVPDTLYISILFATAVHCCFCGCGSKVVTPIHPTGWQLLFDGDTVSLWPSVGNWSFRCRSHYWINKNRVIWAAPMTQEEIDRGRSRDRLLIDEYFGEIPAPAASSKEPLRKKRWSIISRLFGRSSKETDCKAAVVGPRPRSKKRDICLTPTQSSPAAFSSRHKPPD
jgi:hypothetical protein